jgi:hypothetical protein
VKAPKPTSSFKPVPAGMHRAVLTSVIDIGVQPAGNPKYAARNKVMLGFQIPDERRDDGAPFTAFGTYTFSMGAKANLRKLVESWAGKKFPTDAAAFEFEVDSLLGRACQINISHDEKGDKVYANITGVTPLGKGQEKPTHEGELTFYDRSAADADRVYDTLPEWIQKRIDGAIEEESGEKQAEPATAGAADTDDDIPF